MALMTDFKDERFDDDKADALLTGHDAGGSGGDGVAGSLRRPTRRRLDVTPRRAVVLGVTWLGVTIAVPLLVLYGFGPMFQQRSQQHLLQQYRAEIRHAAADALTPFGAAASTLAPTAGSPVGIIEIGKLRLQQVAIEGVGPEQTRQGPGHVPGTAGPGQPGNSALVARRAGFGGPFGSLSSLRVGDPILVTTTQGQSIYTVSQAREVQVLPTAAVGARGSAATVADKLSPKMTVDQLYAPSADNRLTLVTSESWQPWASDRALVVVATMKADPFGPTVQNARAIVADGRHGDGSSGAALALALLAYLAAVVASVLLYRRFSFRSAYLMGTPVLVVCALALGEMLTRVLPAWA